MSSSVHRDSLVFRLIGTLKLATGLLLAATGFGIFRLMNRDVGGVLEHFVTRLHLDPENRLVHAAIGQVGGIDHAHLKAIGAGSFFYALLEGVEGVGLIFQRRWAEYLTILATASLLPLELVELVRKLSVMRLAVLLANLAILVYLIVRMRREHRAGAETSGD